MSAAVRVSKSRNKRLKGGYHRLEVIVSESTIQRLDALVQKAGRPRSEVLSMLIFNEANR